MPEEETVTWMQCPSCIWEGRAKHCDWRDATEDDTPEDSEHEGIEIAVCTECETDLKVVSHSK